MIDRQVYYVLKSNLSEDSPYNLIYKDEHEQGILWPGFTGGVEPDIRQLARYVSNMMVLGRLQNPNRFFGIEFERPEGLPEAFISRGRVVRMGSLSPLEQSAFLDSLQESYMADLEADLERQVLGSRQISQP